MLSPYEYFQEYFVYFECYYENMICDLSVSSQWSVIEDRFNYINQ